MRPVGQRDVESLRVAEFVALGTTWRTRGATPSPQQYSDLVWQGVLAQVLAIQDTDAEGHLVAWLQVYNVEHDSGVGFIGAARFGDNPASFTISLILFLDYVFQCWDLRKLYFEVPASLELMLQPWVPTLLSIEGRLLDRVFSGGKYQDVGIYCLNRSSWSGSQIRSIIED